MGKEATVRLIRRQLRNVVQESLKDVLSAELVVAIRKELGEKVDTGIKTLNNVLHQRLEAIESRTKDVHNLIVRESATGKTAAPTQQIPLISMEPDSK